MSATEKGFKLINNLFTAFIIVVLFKIMLLDILIKWILKSFICMAYFSVYYTLIPAKF